MTFRLFSTLRKMIRIPLLVIPALFLFLISYFVYHTFHGEKGFWSYLALQEKLGQTKKELEVIQQTIQTMEQKIQLLRSNNLDPDLLEERARALLNYAKKDELIILEQDFK